MALFPYELFIGKKMLWGREHKYNLFSIVVPVISYPYSLTHGLAIFLVAVISGCTIEYPSV